MDRNEEGKAVGAKRRRTDESLSIAKSYGPYVWNHSSDIENEMKSFNNDDSKRIFLSSVLSSKGLIFPRKRTCAGGFEQNNNRFLDGGLHMFVGVLEAYARLRYYDGDDIVEVGDSLRYNAKWLRLFSSDFSQVLKKRSNIASLMDIAKSISNFSETKNNGQRDQEYLHSFDHKLSMVYSAHILQRLTTMFNCQENITSVNNSTITNYEYLMNKLNAMSVVNTRLRPLHLCMLLHCEKNKTLYANMIDVLVQSITKLSTMIEQYSKGFDSFWVLVPTPLIIKVCANNSKLATEFVSHLVETFIYGFVRLPHIVAAEVMESESDVCERRGTIVRTQHHANKGYYSIRQCIDVLKSAELAKSMGGNLPFIVLNIISKYFLESNKKSALLEDQNGKGSPQHILEILACKLIANSLHINIDHLKD